MEVHTAADCPGAFMSGVLLISFGSEYIMPGKFWKPKSTPCGSPRVLAFCGMGMGVMLPCMLGMIWSGMGCIGCIICAKIQGEKRK